MLVRGEAEVASWPLAWTSRPDLELVDSLARLQLMAGRLGYSIQLRDACSELVGLLDLAGLARVTRRAGHLVVEVRGEAEGSEQAGVEEVVVPGDPPA